MTDNELKATKNRILGASVVTRKCGKCGDPDMVPVARNWTGMESTIIYKCATCDAHVDINALSHAGMMSALGLGVLAIVSFFMFESSMPWDVTDYLIYAGVIAAVIFVPGSVIRPHRRNPISGSKQVDENSLGFEGDDFIQDYSDPIQKAIIRFEKHGFWRGFLTPIIFVSVILGIATAIGMVNFYFFE